jgi:hypothetical protein
MSRALSGSLEHLSPPALLRLVSATSPSGILILETDEGALQFEVDRGRVREPSEEQLRLARRVLSCRAGTFTFQPQAVDPIAGRALSLSSLAEAAESIDTDTDIEAVLTDEFFEDQPSQDPARIHVLPQEVPHNPLDDLLMDLEAEASEDLLFATIGVVAQDPRFWRGAIERQWRQRGWRLVLVPMSETIDTEAFDAVVVHHQTATARAGREAGFLDLIRRGLESVPPLPVVWVAPLGDPEWVHRLIDAGVSFLIPSPHGDSGEAASRFAADLTSVVDRQLRLHQGGGDHELSGSVSDLVGAILSESDPDRGMRSLLQLTADFFLRGAVLTVDETAIRCRAGFGYALNRNAAFLPRGLELVEQVVGSGTAVTEIEPEADDSCRLAEMCGVDRLPERTVVIPLGRFGNVVGVLVADREGEALPDLDELVVLAGRLGGAVVT